MNKVALSRSALSLAALSLLLVAGCGGKQVPAEALAQVPAERVDALGDIQDRRADVLDRLEVTRSERKRISDRASAAEQRVSKLEKQRKKAQAREVDAIEAGNSALASSEDAAVKAIDEELSEARVQWQDLSDQLEELRREVAMLEDKEAWLDAHLEAERALAAAEGGADIDTAKFTRRAEKKEADYQDARDAWVASLEPADKEAQGLEASADASGS